MPLYNGGIWESLIGIALIRVTLLGVAVARISLIPAGLVRVTMLGMPGGLVPDGLVGVALLRVPLVPACLVGVPLMVIVPLAGLGHAVEGEGRDHGYREGRARETGEECAPTRASVIGFRRH